ncbi:MAG: class I SAM-dependent methyltransferase [Parcubacteria group bacterium]
MNNEDQKTADAFANSWNNLPLGSVYTKEQFEDWLAPIIKTEVAGKFVLELGCGNASLMVYMAEWQPARLVGTDLGDSVESAKKNLSALPYKNWEVVKSDLITYTSTGFDLVYCIGVLHHLADPKKGLDAVISNVKPGGRFHCWVYAREGNGLIIYIVDPIRKIAARLPWWLTKYFIATPLVFPYYLYAKLLYKFKNVNWLSKLPLFDYSLWIAKREFTFFRHVAFDQLVTPQTTYIKKATVENWLKSYPQIDQKTTYIIMRNGNSWKFGGKLNA